MARTSRRTFIELGTGEIPSEKVNQRMEAAADVVIARIRREKAGISNGGAGNYGGPGERLTSRFSALPFQGFAKVVAFYSAFAYSFEGAVAEISRLFIKCLCLKGKGIDIRNLAAPLLRFLFPGT